MGEGLISYEQCPRFYFFISCSFAIVFSEHMRGNHDLYFCYQSQHTIHGHNCGISTKPSFRCVPLSRLV